MLSLLLTILGLVFILLCIFMVLIILIQPSKSGGMAGLAGGAAGGAISETLGATEGEKTLSKWTSVGMAVFFIMCLGLTWIGNKLTSSSVINVPVAEETAGASAPAGTGAAGQNLSISPSGQGGNTIQIPASGTGQQSGNVINIPASGSGGESGGNVITIPAQGTGGENSLTISPDAAPDTVEE